ncbi:MAG: CopG family transcriptional regulator [Gammaproteobacteria bacterium]
MPTLTKTTLYLPEAEYRLLKALARQKHRPASELVREAIVEYTQRYGKRRSPQSLGVGHSGRGDLSEKAEELLTGLGSDS